MEFASKMFGVRRGPLSMRPTWEVLPVRMLRLLLQIAEAEKIRASIPRAQPPAPSEPHQD